MLSRNTVLLQHIDCCQSVPLCCRLHALHTADTKLHMLLVRQYTTGLACIYWGCLAQLTPRITSKIEYKTKNAAVLGFQLDQMAAVTI